jgi:hypothetical protein
MDLGGDAYATGAGLSERLLFGADRVLCPDPI